MKRSLLVLLWPALALAAPESQTARWINGDDVRLRSGASRESTITAILPRATKLSLSQEDGEFCLVAAEGIYGHVACKFLSRTPIHPAKAGEAGIDPAQRWVGGNAVILRAEPKPDAAIVGRMALNSIVRQLRQVTGTAYCEVQPDGQPSGYTACRYLLASPVGLAEARDPHRAFWISPNWTDLERYVEVLKANLPGVPRQGPWPRNEELEKMKAHLALGIKAKPPAALADWQALKRSVSRVIDFSDEAERLGKAGKPVPLPLREQDRLRSVTSGTLRDALRLYGPPFDGQDSVSDARVIRLARALEFSAVQPSLFKSEAEVAPHNVAAEQASGRFGIVLRQTVTRRPAPAATQESSMQGQYDMLSRTDSLVRPVQRVQLFRNGQLQVEPVHLRKEVPLWGDVDEPQCWGWIPGFASGDADAKLWRLVDGRPKEAPPAGSLYAFHTVLPMPQQAAQRKEFPVRLDRGQTGFERGIHLYYDLDHDGIPDLAIWEGEGQGSGRMEVIEADHRWYRLALVNINGAWKVLGSDSFSYDCGC